MSEETNETTVDATPEEATAVATPASIHDLERKMKVNGIVKRLELYGAFIDIGVGVDALIHISKLGREHVNRVADVLNENDEVTVWVDKVDPDKDQIMVSMVEPLAVEWGDLQAGQVYTGSVKRLENFGAFIDIGAEREGLVHISEMSHDYIKHPSEVVSVGHEVQVQVLNYSKRKRRIDLSMKNLLEKPEAELEAAQAEWRNERSRRRQGAPANDYADLPDENEDLPTAMEIALRRAMSGDEDMEAILPGKKNKKKKGRKRKKRRARQEEILNRTLQIQQDS